MESKKHKSQNLETKRNNFFLIGLVFALSATLMAFEYSSSSNKQTKVYPSVYIDLLESEIAPIYKPAVPEPKKINATKTQKITSDIEIVKDLVDFKPEDDYKNLSLGGILVDVPVLQTPSSDYKEDEIFRVVEEMPEYPGGEKALFQYLYKNINYPQLAADAGISGKVYVSFVIEQDGSVSQIELLSGIGAGCDKEAMRVIANMVTWKAGKQRGKEVRVKFTLPINFSLK